MEMSNNMCFQVDSEIINSTLKNQTNYLIDYNNECPPHYCAIYFSSNDLYYPNNIIAFKEQMLNKNKFEWYKTRISNVHKHIFIRDIQKQWYLGGINSNINTPDRLLEFIKKETTGYEVITVGSSAGGFAATIYGQLINAIKILSFNGQFEINSLLNSSEEKINPLIFRNKDDNKLRIWYDTRNFIIQPTTIFYFHSIKSKWDEEQFNHVLDLPINNIGFITSNHGLPFLHSNLSVIINMNVNELKIMTKKNHHPLLVSLNIVGILNTLLAFLPIIRFAAKKIYINTFLKIRQMTA